ncbi:hypothetical protein GHT06_007569 [Daphnia sinensis]|uniref:Uncharacterized protein n=1 Tax=Daphnia sinensis TaxID=1820382 RepID=A0AAD5PLL8_9CRUS|nr:hypothetical protein GHT06_007569 [Daphnia sinensis]
MVGRISRRYERMDHMGAYFEKIHHKQGQILGLDEEIQESTILGTSDERETSADNIGEEENHETHTEAQETDHQELDMAENRRQEEINQAHEKVQEIDHVEINNETGGGEEPVPEIGAEIEIQIEQEEPRRRKQQRPKDKTTRTPPVPDQIDPQADDEHFPLLIYQFRKVKEEEPDDPSIIQQDMKPLEIL